MIYSVASESRAVIPVSPYMYSPFHQAGYRQPSGMGTRSYPSPYEQFVKQAASGIADFLEAAGELRLSAQELGRDTDSVAKAGKLVDSYNETLTRLKEAGGYLNPLIRQSFEEAASKDSYAAIGIRANGDGTLRLDEKAFRESLSAAPERTARTVGGWAGSLEKEAARFQDVPASALINKHMLALQQFAAYQATMQSYLQIPTTGLLINSFI